MALRQGEVRVAGKPKPNLLVDARSGRIVRANTAAARQYRYAESDLAGLPLSRLWPDADLALTQARAEGLTIWRHQRADGAPLDVRVEMKDQCSGDQRLVSLKVSEVSERAFLLALLESQSRFLELLAGGGPLHRLLEALVLAIERLSSGMIGSVLLLDEDGWHVRHGAAPSLPPAYWNAIEGARIGPAAGSCGTAMYSARQVIVTDIERDPVWKPYREAALRHGLRACWSTPIVSQDEKVLGAFALYYRDVRSPGEREKQLVKVATELAALAIERERAARGARRPGKHEQLSAREMQVLRSIVHGEPVKRIASSLGLTPSTVYAHRAAIFETLGVRSDVDLARYAVRHGLVD